MQVSAIIAAGGSGTRLGYQEPKQFLDLRGKPIIAWSMEAFSKASEIGEIVIVAPLEHLDRVTDYAKSFCGQKPFKVVPGGGTRQESVRNGLEASASGISYVAVHDAARPFVTPDEIDSICLMAKEFGAAILVRKVTDTIKEVQEDIIVRTLDRSRLVAALTPQACRKKDLIEAYELAATDGFVATDEASLLEHAGKSVVVQVSESINFKITTEADLKMARAIVESLMEGS